MIYLTHRQFVFRRRVRKIFFFLLFIFICWLSFGIYLTINKKITKLEKIGYSKIEINIINEILNNKQIEKLYNYKYQKKLKDLLVNDRFEKDKLTNYIDYYNKYEKVTDKDLMHIINNGFDSLEYDSFNKKIMYYDDFDVNNSNRYKKYYDKYKLKYEDTIYAVNKGFDKYDIKYNKKYVKFINKDYSIIKRIKRYDSYYKMNKDKSIERIIVEVNCNLDKKDDTKKAKDDKGILIIVNNYYKLDKDYVPDDLKEISKEYGSGKMNEEAYNKYIDMFEDAEKDKVKLSITKSYTSYNEQYTLHKKDKTKYSKPGHSEFQTGLLIEIDNNEWLEKNAYEYGFIKRYPSDKKDLTGYDNINAYRYVGTEVSRFIHDNNISYEEYYTYFVEQN